MTSTEQALADFRQYLIANMLDGDGVGGRITMDAPILLDEVTGLLREYIEDAGYLLVKREDVEKRLADALDSEVVAELIEPLESGEVTVLSRILAAALLDQGAALTTQEPKP